MEHKDGDGLRGGGHRNGNASSGPEAEELVERGGDDNSAREVQRHASHPRNQDQEPLRRRRQQ